MSNSRLPNQRVSDWRHLKIGTAATVLLITLLVPGCKFRQTTFDSTKDASAACYAWRSEGKIITMEVEADEGYGRKKVKIKTYNRECKYDSKRDEYGGYEIKEVSGGAGVNVPDKEYKVKQFRIERKSKV